MTKIWQATWEKDGQVCSIASDSNKELAKQAAKANLEIYLAEQAKSGNKLQVRDFQLKTKMVKVEP